MPKPLPSSMKAVLALERVHFRDRDLLPESPGIYFVLYGESKLRLAYLGRAANIHQRWIGHHRLPEFSLLTMLGLNVEIAWHHLVDDKELAEAEHFLISALSPPLNDGMTLTAGRNRSLPRTQDVRSAAGVVADFRARRQHALATVSSEEFWNDCNAEEDGDLMSLWPFPDHAETMDVNLQMRYESHNLTPFRVVTPPTYAANDSYWVGPKPNYSASWSERYSWTLEAARQVDCFLFAVAWSYAADFDLAERQRTFTLLLAEETVESTLRKDPSMVGKGGQ